VKVGGKRAYRLAREGEAVELAPRSVRVDRFDIVAIRRSGDVVDVDVEVDCSTGTYVRALARDVGATLGAGGHLIALRRTRVGQFGLEEARTLDELTENPRLSYTLDEACLRAFPRRDLTAEETESARHGRALEPAGIDGVYAATASDGQVIALLRDEATRAKSVVVLRPATL
jgi:tRNA pseudouridine55 synthase